MKALWTHRHARRYLGAQTLSLFGDSAMWLAAGIWVGRKHRPRTGSPVALQDVDVSG